MIMIDRFLLSELLLIPVFTCCRDDSKVNAKSLKSLGAKIAVTFGETVTHLVWSNGTHSRLAAAIVLGIKVVSPGWINECKQCQNKVDESDYTVIDISQNDAVAAIMLRSNDSSRFTSHSIGIDPQEVEDTGDVSLRGRRNVTNVNAMSSNNSTSVSSLAELDNKNESGISNEENIKEDTNNKSYQFSNGSSSSSSSSNNMKAPLPAPFIPLPSFKEHNPGVLPSALRTQRRSERICDLDEEVLYTDIHIRRTVIIEVVRYMLDI
jgi:hypothetical protein